MTINTTVFFPGGIPNPVPGNLHLVFPGKIVCPVATPGCAITLNVLGSMVMDAGTEINTNNSVADGGPISITVCGDLTMAGADTATGRPGAVISSQFTGGGTFNGGDITIIVGGVTVDANGNPTCCRPVGNILIGPPAGALKGALITSNSSRHRAGDIAIYAGRNILIQGSVTAQGTGGTGHGGLITIDACCDLKVDDTGIVSSKGLDPGPDRVHLQACTVEIFGLVESTGPGHQGPNPNCTPPARPGKDPAAVACVEIWSGTTLIINGDTTAGHHGQVNADVGQSGGTSGRGWIDALANLDITIVGDPSTPYNAAGNVANNLLPFTPPSPFVPWALHANMALQNGFGGSIAVLAKLGQVTTSGRAIQANASTSSNGGQGGDVVVRAGGTPGDVAFGNASIQAIGDVGSTSQAGGHILAQSVNGDISGGGVGQLDALGGPPAGDVTLSLCVGAPTYPFANSFPAYTFPADCTPVTFPAPANGPLFPSADCTTTCGQITPTPTNTPTPTRTPTSTTATPTPTVTRTPTCIKSEVIGALAGHVPDKVVRLDLNIETIQHAVDTASDTNGDGFVIILVVKDGTGALGGHTNQRVTVSRNDYGHPFQLFGCSVTMHDPDIHDGLPTGWITAGAGGANTIFTMDLHGADSEVAGWKVDGNGRTVRNTGGSGSPVGIWFNGNSNIMHNGAGSGNGIGLRIDGNSNVATDTDLFSNTSHGAQVTGNSNQLLKLDAGDIGKGNGGDGVNVNGTGNLIQECDAYANTLNGISATGGNNTLKKNNGGDRGKGNLQKGFVIGGSGIVRENSAEGNGSYGFDITSGGHTLTSNTSGGTGSGEPNGTCQYNFVAGNTNGGGNRSNGVLLVGAFPLGCVN